MTGAVAETAAEAVAEAKDEATAEAGWWVGAPRFRCGSARTRQAKQATGLLNPS